MTYAKLNRLALLFIHREIDLITDLFAQKSRRRQLKYEALKTTLKNEIFKNNILQKTQKGLRNSY